MLGNAAAQAKILLTAEDRTASTFSAVQRNLSGVGESARNVAGLITGIGATAAIAALTGLVRNTANYADEMSKLAQRAGVTTEAISALSYAARLADVDNNTLARGLREIGNDAAEGGKKLTALGISLTDASGKAKTTDALLMDVADTIAGIEVPARRAAVAAKLFGDRIGPELIPLLAGGAAGLREAAAEAANFGKVVTTEAGRSAELFNDNMTRLTEASSGLAQQFAGPVISSLANASTYFLAVAKDVGFAQAALISFGGAVARTLGFDNVGQLKSQARANSNAIALTVRQIETFQKLADRGVSGAAERVAKLREKFTALQRNGGGITAALGQEANNLSTPTPVPSRRSADGGRGFLNPALATSTPGRPPRPPGGAAPKDPFAEANLYLATLQKQLEATDKLSVSDALLRDLQLGRLGKTTPAIEAALLLTAKQLDLDKELEAATKQALDIDTESIRKKEALAEAGRRVFEETRSPLELLNTELANLQKLLDANVISFDTFARKSLDLEEGIRREGIRSGPAAARANELAIQDFSQTLYGDVKGALSDAFRDTKDPIRAFGDALRNVILTRVSGSIADGLLGKAGVGGGILSGLGLGRLFSFEGGGYTGAGPRSGGMDGRGGFMAMVHPNETVVDHTKGQRAGGQSVVINISNNIGDVSSKGDVVAGMQTVRAQILGELQRSSRYGGAMA